MGFKTKNGVLLKYEAAGALERLGIRKQQDENLSLPKNVTSIGDEAFSMTDVNCMLIPSNVTSIGERAFALCALHNDLIIITNKSIFVKRFSKKS